MEILEAQLDLPNVIRARHAPRGFPSCLHSGQQQPDQDSNNSNHDQQFHQGERSAGFSDLHKTIPLKKK
jgi:hypothetical protein